MEKREMPSRYVTAWAVVVEGAKGRRWARRGILVAEAPTQRRVFLVDVLAISGRIALILDK